MSTTYHVELTDDLIHHFESILESEYLTSEKQVIESTRSMLKELSNHSRSYVNDHTETLGQMLAMLTDKRWNMESEDKSHVLKAMSYLVRDNDIIPDHIPGVGLLDDCIIIDIVANKVCNELEAYGDFKKAEKVYGRDKEFLVSDWLDVKRKELFSRMRARRNRLNKNSRLRSSRVVF